MRLLRLTRAPLFIALILIAIAPALHAQQTIAEQYLFAAANQDRAAQGLPALRFDPVLAHAAMLHAREMAAYATISHQFPGEPELSTRGAKAGVHFSRISENVAEAPTPVIIHNLWMHSPGHRANLLDRHVDTIGIAVVTRNGQLYAVEDFAGSVQTLSLNQQERTVANIIARSGVQVDASTSDARQTCSMSTGYAGSRKPWFIVRYTSSSLSEIPAQLKTRLSTGRYHQAVVGACSTNSGPFTAYNIAVLLYP
jgi:Cysteine-rich secretory protein family